MDLAGLVRLHTFAMRLINLKTFQFTEFFDDAIPPYAILSHRWRTDEVSFQDFLAGHKQDRSGFRKIVNACKIAAKASPERDENSLFWIWIDTCCINKESSAELTEAINSMWRWYRNAKVCLVYLDDVNSSHDFQEGQDLPASVKNEFRSSEWFTRGWTLQELLAPGQVEFLSSSWTRLGSKIALCDDIAQITGIGASVLLNRDPDWLEETSAAEKISWASKRHTSRIEDQAYCLLGLLQVNLPLLYGEGRKAFQRVQEEVIRSSNDESIFTWMPAEAPKTTNDLALFATSPAQFAHHGKVQNLLFHSRNSLEMTNLGLRIDAVLIPIGDGDCFLIPLNCFEASTKPSSKLFPNLALLVMRAATERNVYHRVGLADLNKPELAWARRMFNWRRRHTVFESLIAKFRWYVKGRVASLALLIVLPFLINFLLILPRTFYVMSLFFPCWLYLVATDRRTVFISNGIRVGVRARGAWTLARFFMGGVSDLIAARFGIY